VFLDRGVRLKATDGGAIHLGPNVSVGRNVTIIAKNADITIEENTFVGESCIVVANSGIAVGADCLIGERVTIRDQDHGLELASGPFRMQRSTSTPVRIGDNVWLGANAVVLKGTSIGDDSVVGASAVVTRDVPNSCVALGIPARSQVRTVSEQG
jgi:acetyltransferase-like isoleucine patch superfamily enzyme